MNAEPFTLENATPADLARETRDKANRAELDRRQAAPLIGGRTDTTGDLQAIYGDGWTAYAEGLTIYDNPHDAGTQPARAWADGFAEAAADNA